MKRVVVTVVGETTKLWSTAMKEVNAAGDSGHAVVSKKLRLASSELAAFWLHLGWLRLESSRLAEFGFIQTGCVLASFKLAAFWLHPYLPWSPPPPKTEHSTV